MKQVIGNSTPAPGLSSLERNKEIEFVAEKGLGCSPYARDEDGPSGKRGMHKLAFLPALKQVECSFLYGTVGQFVGFRVFSRGVENMLGEPVLVLLPTLHFLSGEDQRGFLSSLFRNSCKSEGLMFRQ
jgi:hypothetical protein